MIDLEHMDTTRRLTLSGMIMALYVAVMCLTQSFAFGQYQVRVATSLYAAAYFCPFLTVPLGLSNLISNMVMGGLGFFDIFGGGLIGVLTAGSCALIRRLNLPCWLTAVPIALIPAFGVSLWLSGILGVPYWTLAASLLVGQTIAGVLAAALTAALSRVIRPAAKEAQHV